MDKHYAYLLIDIFTILFPLALSFDKKVAFYKQWKNLKWGMILTGELFLSWDIIFTRHGVWSFNDNYITGYKLGGLPIEEWLFFIVVPYSCAFIYACLRTNPPFNKKPDKGRGILLVTGVLLTIAGLIFHSKAYTFSSFTFCGIAAVLVVLFHKYLPAFRADVFLLTFLISLIPFFIVNGLLTSLPVVIYNNKQNLGIRLYTIPVEDVFYGMLLMLGNIVSLKERQV